MKYSIYEIQRNPNENSSTHTQEIRGKMHYFGEINMNRTKQKPQSVSLFSFKLLFQFQVLVSCFVTAVDTDCNEFFIFI